MNARFLGTLLAAAALVPAMLIAQPPRRTDAPAIRLKAATFRPLAGDVSALAEDLTAGAAPAGRRGYYLVQSSAPITEAWKAAVTAAGGELLEYVPDFAFKARMTAVTAARVGRVAGVSWVGPFHPGYKLSPDLARTGTRPYVLTIERGADVASVAAEVVGAGGQVIRRNGRRLTVMANARWHLQLAGHGTQLLFRDHR